MRSSWMLILILLAFSCKTKDNDLYVFDPGYLTDNKITLTDIADDISYIALDNSYLISLIYKCYFINNSIYLSAKDIGILVFNHEGKILRKIGAIGRGPGEYTLYTQFKVDDKRGTVYVKDSGNLIKVYSGSGNFLRSISAGEYGGNIDLIEFQNSSLIAFNFLQFGNAKYNWIIMDTLGNLIKTKERAIPIFTSNWLGESGSYRFKNSIFYWDQYNDTVFSILPDLNYRASFIINPGEHRLPRANFNPEGKLSQYMLIRSIIETNHYIIIRYSFNKKGIIALIEKNSRGSYLSYWETTDIGGIINDLDGGTKFFPKSYFSENDNEYLLGLVHPYYLKNYISTNEFKNSIPKYPEKKKELEKLANSLKENDNPVLMLVRLKE